MEEVERGLGEGGGAHKAGEGPGLGSGLGWPRRGRDSGGGRGGSPGRVWGVWDGSLGREWGIWNGSLGRVWRVWNGSLGRVWKGGSLGCDRALQDGGGCVSEQGLNFGSGELEQRAGLWHSFVFIPH